MITSMWRTLWIALACRLCSAAEDASALLQSHVANFTASPVRVLRYIRRDGEASDGTDFALTTNFVAIFKVLKKDDGSLHARNMCGVSNKQARACVVTPKGCHVRFPDCDVRKDLPSDLNKVNFQYTTYFENCQVEKVSKLMENNEKCSFLANVTIVQDGPFWGSRLQGMAKAGAKAGKQGPLPPGWVPSNEPLPVLEEAHAITNVSAADGWSPVRWNLDRIDQRGYELNWQYKHRGEDGFNTRIFSFDTGINTSHPDFGGRGGTNGDFQGRAYAGFDLWARPQYCAEGTDVNCGQDTHGHGTHVAGVAIGRKNGVAKLAHIYSVKVFQTPSIGLTSGLLLGCEFVHEMTMARTDSDKKDIIHWGFNTNINGPVLQHALELLVAARVPIVVAAGDTGGNACNIFPAMYPFVLTVGATTEQDQVTRWSNTGACVDIFAPGDHVISTSKLGGEHHDIMGGTAVAAAHVAGALARTWSDARDFHYDLLIQYILCDATREVITYGCNGAANKLLYTEQTPAIIDRMGYCFFDTYVTSSLKRHPADQQGSTTPELESWQSRAYTSSPAPAPWMRAMDSLCLPGDAAADTPKGPVELRDLRAGDLVGVGGGAFEPVLGFLHEVRRPGGALVALRHAAGELRASPNHMVFVAAARGGRADKFAGDVRPGDVLLGPGGERREVLAVRGAVSDSGMYAPLTPSGRLVVDGVLASSYAGHAADVPLPHSSVHAFLAPVRLLHGLGLGGLLGAAAAGQEAAYVHPFLKTVMDHVPVHGIHRYLASM